MFDTAMFDKVLNNIDENRMYTKQEIIEQAKMCWESDKDCKYESSNIVVQYAKEILKNVLSLYEDDYKFSSSEFCNLMANIGELWKFETIESMLEIKEVVQKRIIYNIKNEDDNINRTTIYKYLKSKFPNYNKYGDWTEYDETLQDMTSFFEDLKKVCFLGDGYESMTEEDRKAMWWTDIQPRYRTMQDYPRSDREYEVKYRDIDAYCVVFEIVESIYDLYGKDYKMSVSLLERLLKLFVEINNRLKQINARDIRGTVYGGNYIKSFIEGKMENINSLLSEYIYDFINKRYLPFVIDKDYAIPIVWFGDMDKYWASDKKIVTLGLNPSEWEFVTNEPQQKSHVVSIDHERFGLIDVERHYWDNSVYRFDPKVCFYDKFCSEKEIHVFKQSLNDYFRKDPYEWFKKNNKFLNFLDCSYGCTDWDDGKIFKNTGIHIDIYSAIATTPTWGKLSNTQKEVLKNLHLSRKLLDALDPDIILSSVNRDAINEMFADWELIAEYKFKGKNYIRVYKRNKQILINGTNCRGIPFGGIKEEEAKDTILQIINLNK